MFPNPRLFSVLPLLAGAVLLVQGCQTLDEAGSAVASAFQGRKPPPSPPPTAADLTATGLDALARHD